MPTKERYPLERLSIETIFPVYFSKNHFAHNSRSMESPQTESRPVGSATSLAERWSKCRSDGRDLWQRAADDRGRHDAAAIDDCRYITKRSMVYQVASQLHQLRTGFSEFGAFAAVEGDVGRERLAFETIAGVDETVATAVDVRVVDLCGVTDEDEL